MVNKNANIQELVHLCNIFAQSKIKAVGQNIIKKTALSEAIILGVIFSVIL